MLTKLLRTLIGLPFVMLMWIPSSVLVLVHIPKWVWTGKLLPDYRPNAEFVLDWVTLPYQFLKKVWGKS